MKRGFTTSRRQFVGTLSSGVGTDDEMRRFHTAFRQIVR